ncbi:MAG: hypothetical protein WCG27_06525 [Pseudomonadota bacterium]
MLRVLIVLFLLSLSASALARWPFSRTVVVEEDPALYGVALASINQIFPADSAFPKYVSKTGFDTEGKECAVRVWRHFDKKNNLEHLQVNLVKNTKGTVTEQSWYKFNIQPLTIKFEGNAIDQLEFLENKEGTYAQALVVMYYPTVNDETGKPMTNIMQERLTVFRSKDNILNVEVNNYLLNYMMGYKKFNRHYICNIQL